MRSTPNNDQLPIFDAGIQPVSNRFRASLDEVVPAFPMVLCVERRSGLVRIKTPFPADSIRPRVSWLTCYEPEDHLDALVSHLTSLVGVAEESVIAGFSFKDDSTIARFENRGFRSTWRLNPKTDLGITHEQFGVETLQLAFNPTCSRKIVERRGLADVFIVRHVLEHAESLVSFLKACASLLSPTGYLVIEIPDSTRGLESGDATLLWEEHNFYFTEATIKYILEVTGFVVLEISRVRYPLEDVLICIARLGTPKSTYDHVLSLDEVAAETDRATRYGQLVHRRKSLIIKKLTEFRRSGEITIFGAGHFAVTFIEVNGVARLIDRVVDENKHKWGTFFPAGSIGVVSAEVLRRSAGLCLLSFNPNHFGKVKSKYDAFRQNGGTFLSIFPGSDDVATDLQ